jgi:hypothetical protein
MGVSGFSVSLLAQQGGGNAGKGFEWTRDLRIHCPLLSLGL